MHHSFADDVSIKAEAKRVTETAYFGSPEDVQQVDAKLTEDSSTYSAAKYGGLLAAIY
jgi:hypothetical protein